MHNHRLGEGSCSHDTGVRNPRHELVPIIPTIAKTRQLWATLRMPEYEFLIEFPFWESALGPIPALMRVTIVIRLR